MQFFLSSLSSRFWAALPAEDDNDDGVGEKGDEGEGGHDDPHEGEDEGDGTVAGGGVEGPAGGVDARDPAHGMPC